MRFRFPVVIAVAPRLAQHRDMKHFALLLLAVYALPRDASALPADLERAVKDFRQAEIESDVPTLERLFADDYFLVNSDASVAKKREALAPFHDRGFRIEPYVIEQPVEIAWSDGAVLAGLVNLRWTQDGRHQTRRLRWVYVWAKRDGRWQIAYTQVTRLPD